MPLLNNADMVYAGSTGVDSIYAGSNLIWQAVNQASGGVETTYTLSGTTYKVHTFTSSGTLNITRAINPFRVLCVGGGSDGGGSSRGGGGGGVTDNASVTLPTGSIAITVGAKSGTSSVGAYVTALGTSGWSPATGGGVGAADGGTGGNGTQSDIQTGTNIWYAGGGGSVLWNYCCPATGGNGGLGGGGGWSCGGQHATYYGGGGGRVQHTCTPTGYGYQGIVIVRYAIS